jgi:ribosomal protein L18|nr:DUF3489 domain-containing protein [Oricola indica]
MNTQVTDDDANGGATAAAASHAVEKAAPKRKPRAAAKQKSAETGKPAAKTKKDQLVALLSKPNGARISVIVERLGWQPHTVRAALSGLRKQGIEVARSNSPKTGETVATLVGEGKQFGDRAAS